MSDQPPLDLRSLADVDSPEVVREALRTFRRRIVTRYVWLALAIVVFGAAVIWGRTPTTLQQRVDAAHSFATPGARAVWRVEGVTVALDRVADLGDTVGLHFIVLEEPGFGSGGRISVTGQVATMGFGSWEEYVEIERPVSGVPILTIHGAKGSTQIPLDPAHGGFPTDFWR
jgi:hypothetical protein